MCDGECAPAAYAAPSGSVCLHVCPSMSAHSLLCSGIIEAILWYIWPGAVHVVHVSMISMCFGNDEMKLFVEGRMAVANDVDFRRFFAIVL